MACSFTEQLAWKFSSVFEQEGKHPHPARAWHVHSNTLTSRSRLQNLKGLLSSNPNRNERWPFNARRECALLPNQNGPFSLNLKAPSSRVIAQAGKSTQGFLLERFFSSSFKGNGMRPPRGVVVTRAGRSKPRISQPIRPRQRRHVKRPSGQQPDPAGNIHKKKPDHTKQPEPYIRHPDDYYKFGPHGPYDYKAGVVGTLIPVTTIAEPYVFTWSSIKDLTEQEQADVHNACVRYDNRVQTFDQSTLQFFYVFARLPFYIGPEPAWKQWTLVAEITVESRESLDKLSLMSRLGNPIRNRITEFTGWFRPDLIYVKRKRRRYQVRFEPEMDFIRELESSLMESAGEPNERDSYYGEFCQILGLDVNASHEEITSRYEESSEGIQLACVEHLLSKHPVQLLHHMPYPNRAVWMAGQSSGEVNKTSNSEASVSTEPHAYMRNEEEESDAVHVFEDEGPSESDEDEDMEEESDDWGDLDDPAIHAKMRESFVKLKNEELAMLNRQDADDNEGNATDSEDEQYAGNVGDAYTRYQGVSDTRLSEGDSVLKAAVRPYTYVNLIREMVMLREMVLLEKGSLQQIEAGQA